MILPEFTNLPTWAASLIIDFPYDNVPILNDEKDWKDWGNLLIQEDSFIQNNAPGTDTFDNWKSWADELFFIMNNT